MKYQIILDKDYYIYDVRDEELIVENPELDLEISKVGKLNFTIYDDHPYFDKIEPKSSKMEVKKNNKPIFRGRVISDEQGLYNNKKIFCESALAYLNDSILRPNSFNGTPEGLFSLVLNNHNSQTSEEQQLKIGIVTVTDPNNYIARSWDDYLSSWEVLKTRGLDTLGGYLRERYEEDGTYIDWLEDFNDTSTQIVEFGENLMDILVKNDASSTYSVVIPLGAEIEDEEGNKTRLTIASVNNGLDYLVNEEALKKYGWIVAPVADTTFDDVTVPANLKRKGQETLDNQAIMMVSSLDITSLDLQATDADIESFFIYEYVRVKSTPHNINKTFLLNAIKIPLQNPENTQITLGTTTNSITAIELGNKQNIDNVITRVGMVEKDYTINDKRLSELENTIEHFSVDLAQYNVSIPTNSNKLPLETKNYDVSFFAYYKGKQITPNVTINSSNTGITTNKASTYIRFTTNTNTAIPNTLNEYKITFTYTDNGTTYTVTKIIDVVLAIQGADGTGVNILGSYNSEEELIAAHPTGEVGDAYIVQGILYVWSLDNNSWQDVGNIQGTPGINGQDGKSAYQIWLDAGNTGTEEQYLASLKGEQGIPGTPGTNTYFYVRYSANSNGNPMTNAPTTTTKYMGVASTTSNTAPTSYSAYTWTLIKGSDGATGSQGTPGVDGKSSYLHIKYSDDGTTFTANGGETVGRYRGELVDTNEADSTTFSDYTWYDMALLVDEELNSIREEVQTNLTSIQQSMEEITMTALEDYVSKNEFETYQNTISTEFTQTAEDFTFNFNNIISEITTLNGNTQQQFQEISSFIKLVNGNVVIGTGDSEITLVQQHDRVSFIQNNNEVAYFSNNKLSVTDGEFINSLVIGNFALKPRANGNLSLVYVGGE